MSTNRQLLHRIAWTLTLKTETPLYIGGRKDRQGGSKRENQSLSNGDQFIIPGSSIRGVFRSFTSKALITILKDEKTVETLLADFFGSITGDSKKGSIWIGDSYIKKDKLSTFNKNITPIDRFKQIPLSPLVFECVAPNQIFKVQLVIENAKLYQLGIIGLFLRELRHSQIAFGGSTVRGFGNVVLQNLSVEATLYTKSMDKLQTIDGYTLPLTGEHWEVNNQFLYEIRKNEDKNESISWLAPGLQELKLISKQVIS